MDIISEKIKELRKKVGLTQQKFAEKLEITRGVIAQIETGKNNPTMEVLTKINDVFSVNLMANDAEIVTRDNIDADITYLSAAIPQIGIVSISIDKFAKEKGLKPLKERFNRDAKRLKYYEIVKEYENNQNNEVQFISKAVKIVSICEKSIYSDLVNLVNFNYNSINDYYSRFLKE